MNKKIVILNDRRVVDLSNTAELPMYKLKHPKTNEPHSFLLVANALYELVSYNQETSVFVDEWVQSEGLVYFGTKFNLNYFFLSICFMNKSKSYSFNQLITALLESSSIDVKSKEATLLMDKLEQELSDVLFDLDNDKQEIKIKFNEAKCIEWLRRKVGGLKVYLGDNNCVENKAKAPLSEDKLSMEAFELVCQYLDKSISDLLHKELDMGSPLDSTENNKIKRSKPQEIKIE